MGTNTSHSLILETNNIERMRVSQAGNIGIGTSTPSAKLEVNGDFKVGGEIRLGLFEAAEAEEHRFVYTNRDGQLFTMPVDFMLNLAHSKDCFMYFGDMMPSPAWQSMSAPDAGKLYTGTGCPAHVGIGTSNPISTLDVRGDGHFSSRLIIGGNEDPQFNIDRKFQIGSYSSPILYVTPIGQLMMRYTGTDENPLVIQDAASGDELFVINHQGGVEITYQPVFNEATPPQELLADIFRVRHGQSGDDLLSINSDGRLRCQGLVVKHPPFWPDYVFKPDYHLRTLDELNTYIQSEGHLPDMPSEEEIMTNDMDMQMLVVILTEKVEELTLYLIQQQQELQALRQELSSNIKK